ncbi:UdgX family uracil-DNA binding protein [Jatrophihabitans sp.]|uniref:UdgX family uracil-DNA binding protein n=1 Tax=Jatrophihabitans sp. TaxID=1932789 RepID=UPI002B726CB9|nr:UdgX family uracil-DNA binding protein [Jatrophihabitans sp.]
MVVTSTAEPYLPDTDRLPALAEAAAGCRGCELYADATQVVFGRGPAAAPMMLVGEQPGDVEDQRGEPFVGPAGKLLDRALAEAGVDPARSYLTNAVKHFAFTRRGSRRIHQTPKRSHVVACRPWLAAELRAVRPAVLVALGATASQSLFGPSFRLGQHRGEVLHLPEPAEVDPLVVVTVHPSAILRAGDAREEMYAGLVADLRHAAQLLD